MSLSGIDPSWLWLIGGVLLLIAEVIAPGFSLMFIGAAAVLTGIVAFALPVGVPVQLALFAILALVIVRYGGRRAYASRYDYSPDPFLNDRGARLIGRVVEVVEAVDSHRGRVRVGDSEWSARGGPAAVGEKVRIVDVEGNCLKVQQEHVLPGP